MYEYEITKVEKVVDGDTLDVLLDVGFSMFRKERIRLKGIDAPETATRDLKEKEMGKQAKAFAAGWLKAQSRLTARTTKDDKYGRILADIHGDSGVCLNEEMVRRGYAWEYDGGTKAKDLSVLVERRAAQ
jgi:micrococcal nuclease